MAQPKDIKGETCIHFIFSQKRPQTKDAMLIFGRRTGIWDDGQGQK